LILRSDFRGDAVSFPLDLLGRNSGKHLSHLVDHVEPLCALPLSTVALVKSREIVHRNERGTRDAALLHEDPRLLPENTIHKYIEFRANLKKLLGLGRPLLSAYVGCCSAAQSVRECTSHRQYAPA